MDRSEAYNLLTDEMKKLTSLGPDQLISLCGKPLKIDRHGTDGTLYGLELNVEQNAIKRFVVVGSIHDHSGYRFSLLEERIEIDLTEGD